MNAAVQPKGRRGEHRRGQREGASVSDTGRAESGIESPENNLAEGFAHHVVRWARESGAPAHTLPALRAAARAVSLATATGHVCTYLADIAAGRADVDVVDDADAGRADVDVVDDADAGPGGRHSDDAPAGDDGGAISEGAMRALLLSSGMVGTPEAPAGRPLILDGDGRLYLHRYFDYERRLALRLTAPFAGTPSSGIGAAGRLLATLFAGNAERLGDRPDWQKIATALALDRGLAVISGGPGTGKTTTVVNVLACVLATSPDCRIALAAPTGKAAARMLEAMRNAAGRLDPFVRERLPAESFTIHRLLGVVPGSAEFRHHAGNPLPIDLLVVDEASMLDLALATRLFEAVPLAARIILLGDKDQLAAVESGAVFAELSADPTLTAACVTRLSAITGIPAERIRCASPITVTGLTDSVVWLTENFRFARDSGIGRLAAYVNEGDAEAAIPLLRSGTDPARAGSERVQEGSGQERRDTDLAPPRGQESRPGANRALVWIEDANPTPGNAALERILAGVAPYAEAARSDLSDKAALFDAMERFRVLCAEREGARGVDEINRLVGRHVRRTLAHPLDPGPRSEWFPGRPVMVLRNDYVLKLFNGDIGIALPDASGALLVWFPESGGSFRAIVPLRLPEHETAFATTVHKAQGSEFDEVLLLLPAKPTRVVTRELLYTAVTRARARVTVVGGAEVLERAIGSPTRRYTGLAARLDEARSRP